MCSCVSVYECGRSQRPHVSRSLGSEPLMRVLEIEFFFVVVVFILLMKEEMLFTENILFSYNIFVLWLPITHTFHILPIYTHPNPHQLFHSLITMKICI